jgi:hypothetical protein
MKRNVLQNFEENSLFELTIAFFSKKKLLISQNEMQIHLLEYIGVKGRIKFIVN